MLAGIMTERTIILQYGTHFFAKKDRSSALKLSVGFCGAATLK
jgi:hypothetical protein